MSGLVMMELLRMLKLKRNLHFTSDPTNLITFCDLLDLPINM